MNLVKYKPGSNGEPAYLTPTEEEQSLLVLQGKCPHNNGWRYGGHGHNSEAWECMLCRTTKWH